MAIQLYSKGVSIQSIANQLGISGSSFYRLLKENGLNRSLSQSLSSNYSRDTLFSELPREEVQYWLGFIAADGSLSYRGTLSLNLSPKDFNHLNKYIEFSSANFLSGQNYIRAYFDNKQVAQRLISYGITPSKTRTLEMNIPITRHFIRGVFDGDGCISLGKKSNKFSIVSASEKFAVQIFDFFKSESVLLNFNCYNGLYMISTGAYDKLRVVNEILYKDSTVFLERKKAVFGSVIEKSITKQFANSGKVESLIPSQQ